MWSLTHTCNESSRFQFTVGIAHCQSELLLLPPHHHQQTPRAPVLLIPNECRTTSELDSQATQPRNLWQLMEVLKLTFWGKKKIIVRTSSCFFL